MYGLSSIRSINAYYATHFRHRTSPPAADKVDVRRSTPVVVQVVQPHPRHGFDQPIVHYVNPTVGHRGFASSPKAVDGFATWQDGVEWISKHGNELGLPLDAEIALVYRDSETVKETRS